MKNQRPNRKILFFLWIVKITYSFEFASKLRLRNSSILCPVCCSHAVFSASKARLFSSSSRTCCSNERRICSCLLCNYFPFFISINISTLLLLLFMYKKLCDNVTFASVEVFSGKAKKSFVY